MSETPPVADAADPLDPNRAPSVPLAAALRAFQVGDFGTVGRIARAERSSSDAAARSLALVLLDRLRVDPVVFLLVGASFLFAFVSVWTTTRH